MGGGVTECQLEEDGCEGLPCAELVAIAFFAADGDSEAGEVSRLAVERLGGGRGWGVVPCCGARCRRWWNTG